MIRPVLTAQQLAELRSAFLGSLGDLGALEVINAKLRDQISDGAIDLQCDVAAAMRTLRSAGATTARHLDPPTTIRDVLDSILADAGVARPDGRSLHRYRVSDNRFAELRATVERMHRLDLLENPNRRSAAVFALYCAEWFRRDYVGGQYAWEMPHPTAIGSLPNAKTRELTQEGLRWWGLKPRVSGGRELRLQSLILEGGFPTRLLESREHGRIATHLRGLLARLERRAAPTEEDALALSHVTLTNLGQFDHEGFHLLCAELALAILDLRREVQAEAPPGVSASIWLDRAKPSWRDDLPISLAGDGAKRLLDDLVSERTERLASNAVCQRLLIATDAGWTPAVQLGMSGEVAISVSIAEPSVGRLRIFATGALSSVFAGELGLLEPPTELGQHWLCRPRGSALQAPFDFVQPVRVELRSGDSSPVPLTWPNGEARRSEMLVLADARGDDASTPPTALAVIGAGSMSTRRRRAYLWTPADFTVVPTGGGDPLTPIWQGWRRLFEVTGSVYAGVRDGDRYRVELGADKDRVDQLDFDGLRLRGAEAKDSRLELYAGLPHLRVRTGGRGQSPKPGEVQWRCLPAGKPMDWANNPPIDGAGPIEVVWRDATANITRDRRRVVVLPDGAGIWARPSGAMGVAFQLEGLDGWSVTSEDRSLAIETSDAALTIQFPGKPLRRLTLELRKGGTEATGIVVTTRLKSGGFARADGTLFQAKEHIVVEDLRGAVAFADGRERVYLRNSSGAGAHFAFTDELPLWSLSEDITRLLAGGSSLDEGVTIELGLIEGRKLQVGRYMADMQISGREVSISSEPVPSELTTVRSLEWFSIRQPATKVLDSRSWKERIIKPSWTLPEDIEGPGLVFLRERGRVIGRPTLFIGSDLDGDTDLCGLQRAALIEAFFSRQKAIDTALAHLTDASAEAAADRNYLLSLITALDGIPAAALNVLEHLSANTAAQAALMAAALDDTAQGKIWKLERELPFMWALIPFADWARAFDAQRAELARVLDSAGLSKAQAESVVTDTIVRRTDTLTHLEPMLTLPLSFAGAAKGDGASNVTLAGAAQDRVRRAGDQAPAADAMQAAPAEPGKVSCFRAPDCTVRDRLPAVWPFHAGHWEGLDAACAAALSAAGQAILKPKHIQRIRAAHAQEPLSFADIYAASLRLLAQQLPLAV